MILARSSGVFASPPTLSNAGDIGWMPAVFTDPGVAFIPYSAARVAGCTSEPSVSVPIDTGAKPAATPTALPEDDPQGVWKGAKNQDTMSALVLGSCSRYDPGRESLQPHL